MFCLLYKINLLSFAYIDLEAISFVIVALFTLQLVEGH